MKRKKLILESHHVLYQTLSMCWWEGKGDPTTKSNLAILDSYSTICIDASTNTPLDALLYIAGYFFPEHTNAVQMKFSFVSNAAMY